MEWENNMDDPRPLVNIGDLAKPVDTFVTKISDAIGGLYRPTQIKRIAQAEAEADKIRAVAQIEVTDIQRRAVARFFMEESRKQENMESIIGKAVPHLTEQAQPDLVENDWIVHFFDRCRLTSDDDMQTLWARVLSDQANAPGSYSKKTIDVLATLEKSDAMLFSKLCSFSVILDDSKYPLIYDTDQTIYNDQGITWAALSHLKSLGVIHFDSLEGYAVGGLDEKVSVSYFNIQIPLKLTRIPPDDIQFSVGNVLLTQAGEELARICETQPMDGFVDYLKWQWNGTLYFGEGENTAPTASQGA